MQALFCFQAKFLGNFDDLFFERYFFTDKCRQNVNSVYIARGEEAVRLLPEEIESFLAELERRGRRPNSLQTYRMALEALGACLPEGKRLTRETPDWWRGEMERQGYAPGTIRNRLSALNSFLQYKRRRDWRIPSPSAGLTGEPAERETPELAEEEYLRLLETARRLERQGVYLLLRTLGGLDVRLQELPQVTAEQVREGTLRLRDQNGVRLVPLPEDLRRELLEFAGEEGPVFVTRDGAPMDRAVVWRRINRLSGEAGVAPEKANPRCLRKLYLETRERNRRASGSIS